MDMLSSDKLTAIWKSYVMRNLAHEIGHCYIWELEGTQRDNQKVATLIGDLFLDAWRANIHTTVIEETEDNEAE